MNFKNFISQNLQGKKVLYFFLAASFIYFLMLFVTIPMVNQFSGGMRILDLKPDGYNADYVKSLFGNLGKTGRKYYLYRQLPLDFIYPGLFAISNTLILSYFLKYVNRFKTWFFLTLFPILGGVFDYFENLGIIYLLKTFPKISEISVRIISAFSILKSAFTTIYFVILLLLLVLVLFRKLKSRN